MASPSVDAFVAEILGLLTQAAVDRVEPEIDSITLREALRVLIDVPGMEGKLFIPHYWAVYFHDGRGGFGPRDATFLVFFERPQDDPRLPGGKFPERASQLRRLTAAEFNAGLAENTRRHRLGLPPFMFVIKNDDGSPGRVGPASGHPFFVDGMLGFGDSVSSAGGPEMQALDDYVQREIDDLHEEGEARATLG